MAKKSRCQNERVCRTQISVLPSGELIRHHPQAYGWIGNRGVLHNGQGKITKPFASKAWLACTPSRQANDPKRPLTEPGRYTLLRFLDEATALSAGHRPCWTCRRADFHRFLAAWTRGNLGQCVEVGVTVAAMDTVLHRERIDTQGLKVSFAAPIESLPGGCIAALGDTDYLVRGDYLFRWSPTGYTQKLPRPANLSVRVWTPRSVVAAFRAGYVPHVDPSVDAV